MPDFIPRDYSSVKVSSSDFENQAYKRYFGGGSAKWELRGAFQCYFLEKMGMQIFSSFLDIGCGPLRGGSHIIKYLNADMYQGVDYNADFIDVARTTVEQNPSLKIKKPQFQVLQNFAFEQLAKRCDFALVFSVLNHCAPAEKTLFFEALPHALRPLGRVYITHAYWFESTMISAESLTVTKVMTKAHDIALDLELSDWGWEESESIFPILELTLTG